MYFGFGSDWAPPLGPGPTDPSGTLPGPLPRPKGKQLGLHVRENPLRVCHMSKGGTLGVGYKSKGKVGELWAVCRKVQDGPSGEGGSDGLLKFQREKG